MIGGHVTRTLIRIGALAEVLFWTSNLHRYETPISKVMDSLLNLHYKDLKQTCEHSAKLAHEPSQNWNRIVNSRSFLMKLRKEAQTTLQKDTSIS